MSDLIRRDSEPPIISIARPGNDVPETGRGNPLLRMLRSVRRHWWMVLAAWILVAVPASAWIWYRINPTFTASADVTINPNETPIIYRDLEDSSNTFDGLINTEAYNITSTPVLTETLADAQLKGAGLLKDPDPLSSLRRAVKVTQPSRTFLLHVEVTQDSPADAIAVTEALMRAYAKMKGGARIRKLENDAKVLREEAQKLADEKKGLDDKKNALAMPRASTNQSVYASMQEGSIRLATELRLQQSTAEAQRTELKSKLAQLEKGLVPTTMPTEDLVWRDQQIERDEMVRSLRAELAKVTQQLAKPGNHAAYEEEKRRLDTRLAEEVTRAAGEADRLLDDRHRRILDDQMKRAQVDLQAIEDRIANLNRDRLAIEEESKQNGQIAIQIKNLDDQLEANKSARQVVDERLHAMEVEAHRADRITVDTQAEVLPSGIRDRRTKLMAMSIAGGLFLGVFLAFVRDHLSGSLHTAEDVETAAGLNLLGTLPSLEDLRRGRITESDFRESYRAIRATLAGRSPGGQIPKTILVTSAQAAEGKTSLAVSLAASLAEDVGRVLVIDGDVQAPRIASTLKLDLPYTLRHVLLGERPLLDAVGPTPVPGLDVLLGATNGQSANGLLTGGLAARLVKAACEHYDHVIIDSPPTLGSADALIWAQAADGVVLSSLAGHSNLHLVRDACQRLAAAGGHILGAVICNVSVRERFMSYSRSMSRYAESAHQDQASAEADQSKRCPHINLTSGKLLPGNDESGKSVDKRKRSR